MKRDNAKSQKRCGDRKSDTARKGGSVRLSQPLSVQLTCHEAELEDLMSEGEST